MNKKLLVILFLILIVPIVAGCGDTVATVNGDKISQSRLDKIVNLYVYQAGQAYGTDPTKDEQLMSQIKEAALNSLVEQVLLVQEAKRRGMEATDKEVKEAIAAFKESSGDEGYKNFLSASGMTENEFKDEMYEQVVVDELHTKVISPIKVSETEIKKYYDNHPEEFGNLREVRVSHIVVKTKAEAEDIIKKIKTGEDFAALAKKYSIEQSAKDTGGDLGYVSEKTNFVTEFKTAALKLKPGEMTEQPVKTQFGYHIIKCSDERLPQTKSYQESKDQARSMALSEKQDQAWMKLVDKLRSQSEIEIKNQKDK